MRDTNSFWRAVVVVTLALAGGQALHWFLTPLNHPDAGLLRTLGVAIQAIAGIGGSLWLSRRAASSTAP
jgi:hypothetical protein